MRVQGIFEYSDGFVLVLYSNGLSDVVQRNDEIVRLWLKAGGKISDKIV